MNVISCAFFIQTGIDLWWFPAMPRVVLILKRMFFKKDVDVCFLKRMFIFSNGSD